MIEDLANDGIEEAAEAGTREGAAPELYAKVEGDPLPAEKVKDRWRTPPWLFDLLHRQYGFVCDLFADASNTLVPDCYFTREISAYGKPWPLEKFSFGNPPFSTIQPGQPGNLELATRSASVNALDRRWSVLLLPAYTMEKWFRRNVYEGAADLIFFEGRLAYCDETGKEIPANRFGSCLAIYGQGSGEGHAEVTWKNIKTIREAGTL